ncbi:MarR family winged helix-turn-helix transcriptional regulator [Pontibacillus litoralis]|uniref:MarR family transcriptional regulator n=1 Tax=Pontibacillus litoralis JSM 072002 TaxID=1385512 RepID=A0A0A5GAL5_9BACI|nr:MarR family transcriptional regulator [Pontibacillus litoralis]KGX89039.1 MarR family transcriptional regulator [Pontibacillus litoralis JSM 072002]
MDNQPIADIEKKLRYTSCIIKQKGREILDQYPITLPQFLALQWLLEFGDMTIGELSNHMHLAYSTTTDLVDRLERNEVVQRVKDEKDRRVVQIRLLDKGKSIIQEVIDKRQAHLEHVFRTFSSEHVELFRHLLNEMYDEMKCIQEEEMEIK